MPTNVTIEYSKAEQRYALAKTMEEKLAATEEMIRFAPKHKGTEKLLSTLKRRLAKLRQEVEEKRERRSGRASQAFALKKEGAAQIVLLGQPNSGKSFLLRKLTAARPEVADYPFTTLEPTPGMMQFEDVQIQLVEVPAVVEGSSVGRGLGASPLSVARSADAIAFVVDATSDLVRQTRVLLQELDAVKVKVNRRPPAVSVERRSSSGIDVKGGNFVEGGEGKIKSVLLDHGVHNAVVIIDEPLTMEEFEDALEKAAVYVRAFVFVTKCDAPGAAERIQKLRDRYGGMFTFVFTNKSEDALKKEAYAGLNLIRVYTKPPDGEPSKRPLVVPKDSKVADVARIVHKDFEERLKFARVWGATKFPGQQVSKDYILHDRDILELHV